MAILFEIRQDQQAWIEARPAAIKAMIARHPPNRLYRLKPTAQRVTIYSYAEGGTVTVEVTGQFNATMFDRQVFGINPDDLEECELPAPGEILGAVLTKPEDVDAFIDVIRPEVLKARGSIQ